MKKKYIIAFLILISIPYLLVSFVKVNINFTEWGEGSRVFCAITTVAMLIFYAVIVGSDIIDSHE